MTEHDSRRHIPAVETVRLDPALADYAQTLRADIIVQFIRRRIEFARQELASQPPPSAHELAQQVAADLHALLNPAPQRTINATGIMLHTGLGRAPLSADAMAAIQRAAQNCNLELSLDSGDRGDRQTHVRTLLTVLTGAESALVVNNNAAALYLTLNALAYRKEVIVSRGQLIEIGGSFRLPQIMERAGVKLVEVGTTNRTRIEDYRAAVTSRTALLLRAYPSNYRIEGFHESVSIAELVALGRERSIPVVDDLGGGLLDDWTHLGLPYEPTICESLDAGADLVLVSGDKVLGGPQAGIALGRAQLIQKLAKSPLARVLRADKLCLAALNATLLAYVTASGPVSSLPVWQMLTDSQELLRKRAQQLVEKLRPLAEWKKLEMVDSTCETGSGTLPASPLLSVAIRLQSAQHSAAKLAGRLRKSTVPVVCKLAQDALWFDLRTLRPADESDFLKSLTEALRKEK